MRAGLAAACSAAPEQGQLRHNQAGVHSLWPDPEMGKHKGGTVVPILILVPLWQGHRPLRRAQQPPWCQLAARTCRDGVEAQGEGWSVPQLH